jgi:hypothetical protein
MVIRFVDKNSVPSAMGGGHLVTKLPRWFKVEGGDLGPRRTVTVRVRNRAELAAAFLEEIRSSVLRFGRLLSGGRAASASCLHLTPPKDVRLYCLPRCTIPPLAVYALTREWKDVGSNMILSQNLHR